MGKIRKETIIIIIILMFLPTIIALDIGYNDNDLRIKIEKEALDFTGNLSIYAYNQTLATYNQWGQFWYNMSGIAPYNYSLASYNQWGKDWYNHTLIVNASLVGTYGQWWYNMSNVFDITKWLYNQTDLNTTWAYNQTTNSIYYYNFSTIDESKFWYNMSQFDAYNYSLATYNQYGSNWYNHTLITNASMITAYGKWLYNQSLYGSQWYYNQTNPAVNLTNATMVTAYGKWWYNQTGLYGYNFSLLTSESKAFKNINVTNNLRAGNFSINCSSSSIFCVSNPTGSALPILLLSGGVNPHLAIQASYVKFVLGSNDGSGGTGYFGAETYHGLDIMTNNVIRMRITKDGAVGIVENLSIEGSLHSLKTQPSYYGLYDGLVLHIPFDKTETTTVYDRSRYGNDGDVTGAVYTKNGKFGGAFRFKGTADGDVIRVSDSPSTDITGDITVSAWIYVNGTHQGGTGVVAGKRGTTSADTYELLFSGTDARFIIDTGSATYSTIPVPIKQWHHLVGTWVEGGAIKLYLDGVLVDTDNKAGSMTTDGTWLYIGGPSSGYNFNGTIDEVMIWNRTLSSNEVMNLYLQSLGTYGMFYVNGSSVGIGTANPTHTLNVVGNARITTDLNVGTNNTLVVNSVSDEVGIGTTNPTHKLNVVGSTNITSQLYIGLLVADSDDANFVCVEPNGEITQNDLECGAHTPKLYDWEGNYLRKVASNSRESLIPTKVILGTYGKTSNYTFTIANEDSEVQLYDKISLEVMCFHTAKNLMNISLEIDAGGSGTAAIRFQDGQYLYLKQGQSITFDFDSEGKDFGTCDRYIPQLSIYGYYAKLEDLI